MKIIYELNETDILEIIAEYFKVPIDSLIIKYDKQKNYITIRIEKNANCN